MNCSRLSRWLPWLHRTPLRGKVWRFFLPLLRFFDDAPSVKIDHGGYRLYFVVLPSNVVSQFDNIVFNYKRPTSNSSNNPPVGLHWIDFSSLLESGMNKVSPLTKEEKYVGNVDGQSPRNLRLSFMLRMWLTYYSTQIKPIFDSILNRY